MSNSVLRNIDKYTPVYDGLAISGQPSMAQIAKLATAGVQMVVNLQIREIDAVVENERKLVLETGILYEQIPVSFQIPSIATYHYLEQLLNDYANLNILVHCAAGYCTSGLLLPYIVKNHDFTLETAREKLIVREFSSQWTQLIEAILTGQQAQAR